MATTKEIVKDTCKRIIAQNESNIIITDLNILKNKVLLCENFIYEFMSSTLIDGVLTVENFDIGNIFKEVNSCDLKVENTESSCVTVTCIIGKIDANGEQFINTRVYGIEYNNIDIRALIGVLNEGVDYLTEKVSKTIKNHIKSENINHELLEITIALYTNKTI